MANNNRRAIEGKLPEDDPSLAGLIADLRTLHRDFPPTASRRRAASVQASQRVVGDGAIMLGYGARPIAIRARTTRARMVQWSAVVSILMVLGIATGALSISTNSGVPKRPILGAHDPASGIPTGARTTLTIDSYVQSKIAEPKLAALVRQFEATSGSIVVERPSDGAIIAMASLPSADTRTWQQVAATNAFGTYPDRAAAVANPPSETMMALTAAIGLDAGRFDEHTQVFNSGLLKTEGITVRDWCGTSCTFGGPQTIGDMLEWGSSIDATQFARLIPSEQYYDYLNKFGFGQPQMGPGLPNASGGALIEAYITMKGKKVQNPLWQPSYKDTTAFGGTGITTTALQLANAYAALANGGMLMQPKLVKSYTINGKTTEIPPRVLHVVFQNSDTARKITNVLVAAQALGEGCEALVPGYDVAVKTGTASKYIAPANTASTVAYGPVGETNPAKRFVVLIELQHPSVVWGSETAAPAVSSVLKQLFKRYRLKPSPKPVQPTHACPYPNAGY